MSGNQMTDHLQRSSCMRRRRIGTALAALVLLTAGCQGAEEPDATTGAPAAPPPAEEADGAEQPGAGEERDDEPEPDRDPAADPDDAEEPDEMALDDVQLQLEAVADGFDQPIGVTAPEGDDRLFVLERAGRVWLLDGDDRELFLDVSDATVVRGEEGLLGLAFDPAFADNGRFVVHHTDLDGANRVAAYDTVDGGGIADPGSRRELLRVAQPASNHNGGMVAFGPDGMLYVAIGDGGGSGDRFDQGQRPDTLLGTILRLDLDGEDDVVPRDNPFAEGGEGAPEVWHHGLRNPWRFSFDGDELYIADVGQNRFEEVNVVAADEGGLNFGWPIMEASSCFDPPEGCDTDGLVLPVYDYPISGESDCAIIGGFVYRGEDVPGLQGHYLYTDFCSGAIRSFRHEDGAAVDQRDWTAQTGAVATPYSWGRDGAGELYLTEVDAGRIVRLAPAG
jgi:glucose/arabinose dehydrogenase